MAWPRRLLCFQQRASGSCSSFAADTHVLSASPRCACGLEALRWLRRTEGGRGRGGGVAAEWERVRRLTRRERGERRGGAEEGRRVSSAHQTTFLRWPSRWIHARAGRSLVCCSLSIALSLAPAVMTLCAAGYTAVIRLRSDNHERETSRSSAFHRVSSRSSREGRHTRRPTAATTNEAASPADRERATHHTPSPPLSPRATWPSADSRAPRSKEAAALTKLLASICSPRHATFGSLSSTAATASTAEQRCHPRAVSRVAHADSAPIVSRLRRVAPLQLTTAASSSSSSCRSPLFR